MQIDISRLIVFRGTAKRWLVAFQHHSETQTQTHARVLTILRLASTGAVEAAVSVDNQNCRATI